MALPSAFSEIMAVSPPANGLSTIAKIADEGLALIFWFYPIPVVIPREGTGWYIGPRGYTTPKPDPRLLRTLMLVCRRWHTIITNNPKLWASIHSKICSPSLANILLVKSKCAPLDCSITFSETSWTPAEIKSLLLHFNRIQELVLMADDDTYATLPAIPTWDALARVHLSNHFIRSSRSQLPIRAAHKLTDLVLENVIPCDDVIHSFPNLKVLKIKAEHGWPRPLTSLLTLLNSAPRLHTLTLHVWVVPELLHLPSPEPQIEVIDMKHLRSFFCGSVSGFHSQLLHLGRYLNLPAGCLISYQWPFATSRNRLASTLPTLLGASSNRTPFSHLTISGSGTDRVSIELLEDSDNPATASKVSFSLSERLDIVEHFEDGGGDPYDVASLLLQHTCDITFVKGLDLRFWEVSGIPNFSMFPLFSGLKHLSSIQLHGPGETDCFASAMLQACETSMVSFPALQKVEVDIQELCANPGCYDCIKYVRVPAWTDVLALLHSALIERQAITGALLPNLIAERHPCRAADREQSRMEPHSPPSWSDQNIIIGLEAIATCVEHFESSPSIGPGFAKPPQSVFEMFKRTGLARAAAFSGETSEMLEFTLEPPGTKPPPDRRSPFPDFGFLANMTEDMTIEDFLQRSGLSELINSDLVSASPSPEATD